ncbi:MFS transporter [Ramlibacter sp. 2FC]|uniref:MFS transporter n=1 Tax=Ramlibacter sp. 2FC TaxID=2502188 RepID=UPI0010F63B22|nr:MFS transporter [Ramlibacter sp. 2FC]
MSLSTTVHAGAAPHSQSEIDTTYRKITWRLIPFLAFLWLLAWIDRVNVGYVKLTMLDELKWSESVYGLGAGIFFLGYFFFEIPSNLMLQKIGAKKTLMRITIGWGATCIAMMFAKTPEVFYALRFLMGAFEAGFLPGVIVYLTYWFPSGRRAKVLSLITAASALSSVVGGPLAGNILNLMGGVGGLSSWQWVFLIEGTPTVLAGVFTYFYLTDRPQEANWLSAREKQLVAAELERDHQALGHREHSVFAALKDARLWLFVLIYFSIVAANATLNFYGPSIVKELGYTNPATIGWIMSGAFLLGAVAQIANGSHSDRQQEVRWHCAGAALLGVIGMLIVAISLGRSPALVLTGLVIAVIGTSSAFPVFWQMPNRLLSGAAAAVGVALINSIANLAGFGSPFMLAEVKAATGGLSPGLFVIAAVELLAVLLILWFVPKHPKARKAA